MRLTLTAQTSASRNQMSVTSGGTTPSLHPTVGCFFSVLKLFTYYETPESKGGGVL